MPARTSFATITEIKSGVRSNGRRSDHPGHHNQRKNQSRMNTELKILAASILIVIGYLAGMGTNVWYAFDAYGKLPDFVTPSYLKFATCLSLFVILGTGICLCTQDRGVAN